MDTFWERLLHHENPPPFHNRIRNRFTLTIHYGGTLNPLGSDLIYDNGNLKKYDYMQMKNLTMGQLNVFCNDLNLKESRVMHASESESEVDGQTCTSSLDNGKGKLDIGSSSINKGNGNQLVAWGNGKLGNGSGSGVDHDSDSSWESETRNRDKARAKWGNNRLCPKINEILHKTFRRLRYVSSRKCDDTHYQVTKNKGCERYNVSIEDKICTCRSWQLTGIPCLHAMSALVRAKEDPYLLVSDYYTVETYNRVYQGAVYGINGADLWGSTLFIPPLPPNFGKKKQVGRHEKKRKLGEDEKVSKKKNGRNQLGARCGDCGEVGHNKRRCPRNRPGISNDKQRDLLSPDEEEQGKDEEQLEHNSLDDFQDVYVELMTQDLLSQLTQNEAGASTQPSTYTRRGRNIKSTQEYLNTQTETLGRKSKGSNKVLEAQDDNVHQVESDTPNNENASRPGASRENIEVPSLSNVLDILATKTMQDGPSMYKQFHPEIGDNLTFTRGGKKFVRLSNLKAAVSEKKTKRVTRIMARRRIMARHGKRCYLELLAELQLYCVTLVFCM